MNKFIILEEERERILNLHRSRTSELYLNEQSTPTGTDECFINQNIPLDTLPNSCKDLKNNYGPCSSELMKGEFYNTEDKINRVDAALDCVSKKLRS